MVMNTVVISMENHDAAQIWCIDHIGIDSRFFNFGNWYFVPLSDKTQTVEYCFKNSEDAVMFALRWL